MNEKTIAVEANDGTSKYCQMLREKSNPKSYRGMCDQETYDSDYTPTDDEMVILIIS